MNPPVTTPRFDAIEMSDREFDQLSRLVYENCGICLGDHKRALLRARLMQRLRKLGLSSFRAYYHFVTEDDAGGEELFHLLDAISTNLTEFFRESQHFDFLRGTFFARWEKEKSIRVLSAGCSSGEEPYSIAICALERFGADAERKVCIHAGDLSRRMLAVAQAGIYGLDKVSKLGREQLHRYFLKGTGNSEGLVRIAPEVRKMIRFDRINLTTDLPYEEPFHAIFCRNVAIYFDRETQASVFDRLGRLLAPGGHLFVGHSESMSHHRSALRYVQPTVYEKC